MPAILVTYLHFLLAAGATCIVAILVVLIAALIRVLRED